MQKKIAINYKTWITRNYTNVRAYILVKTKLK